MSASPPEPPWCLENYRPLLRLLAWQLHLDPRLQRRFDGSDVVQETMVHAVDRLAQFDGHTEAELICWLQKILNNTFCDMVRHEKARMRTFVLEAASLDAVVAESSARLERFLAADQSSPSERAERQEVLLRWASAVEALPSQQRDIVILRDLYQLPVKAIAERTDQTEKAVAGLLARGRQRLRASFPDYA
jgi:RNA polymerase sigma-70 factor (ECF subfamily)